MPTDSQDDPSGRRLLRCDRCGWTQAATPADTDRYARDAWPTCCGQPMGYVTGGQRPTDPPKDSGET